MSSQLHSRSTPVYGETINRLMDPLNAIIHHHPLIASGAWPEASLRPQRLSDFQGQGAFKHNPLYHDVYRHLDSHFQLAYNVPTNDAHIVCLTWNRLHRDFTERDRDMLHLIGHRLEVVLRHLRERERLERACGAMQSLLPRATNCGPPVSLSPTEGRLLASLIRGKTREEIATHLGWRRDTVDRRLAVLRERIGLENTPLLLRMLNELRPSPAASSPDFSSHG